MKLPCMYGLLSPTQRRQVREQYVQEQKGLCMHCGESLSLPPPESITSKSINWRLFPPNFLQYPVHLQHCHDSGLTEGAVHAYCNAVLWQYHFR
jgi:hypothetical protein